MPRQPYLVLVVLLLLAQGCATVGHPKVIYLARHGQTEWNRKSRFQGDPDLDAVGYVNRFSLWRLTRKRPLHTIYTSERLRTRRTAELVSRQHDLPIKQRAALNEIEPGVLEGFCFGQVMPRKTEYRERNCEVQARSSTPEATLIHARKVLRRAWRDRIDGKIPLGESFRDVVERTRAFTDELSRGLADREVLVVGHGVVNRALLHHLFKWPLQAVARLRQDNDQVYRIEGANTGAPRLFLYTPGTGWRRCSPPRKGNRHLDCHPMRGAAKPTPTPTPTPTPPMETEPEEQDKEQPPAATQPSV
jgi:probable phosphoglycerate mutase